jgi:hypothetical protein
MDHPWDRPQLPDKGARAPEPLYQAVGKALTYWELVEQAIGGLFTFVTTGRFFDASGPALRAYGSIVGNNARIQMVRAAVESWSQKYPTCQHLDTCRALLKECEGWSARGNDIAHGRVDNLIDAIPNGWMLFPGLYNTNKRSIDGRSKYRYTAEHIEEFARGFLDLHNRMDECTSAISVWLQIHTGTSTG